MIVSALRNGVRGALAATLVYPLAERFEKRDIRSKANWIRAELDRPFEDRKRRALERLVEIVHLAGHKVPYYRDLFAALSFDPEKLTSDARYLEDLPYLTKDIIREQGHRLLRDDREGLRIHTAKTGGSTGPSAHIYYDQEAADWSSAINRESRRRIGNSAWRSELHFASKFPEVFPWKARIREAVKCFAMNRDNVFFSTFGDDELASIWRQVRAIRPHLLHAHPSTVDQLAQYVERTRGSDRAFAIFESSGELLEPSQRERIERVLRCTVIDRYGLAEAGVLAYQLDAHIPRMRYFEFFAWPEVAPAPDVTPGEGEDGARAGELVITPLFNTLMPLIRYRTGDNIVLAEREAGFEVLRMVGRIHDVVTISGTPLPTHYIQDVLDRVGGIREFQIEVREGKPVFRLVPEPGVDTAGMAARIQSWWPGAVSVEFIEPSELKLVGSRQKFRHLVQPVVSEAAAK